MRRCLFAFSAFLLTGLTGSACTHIKPPPIPPGSAFIQCDEEPDPRPVAPGETFSCPAHGKHPGGIFVCPGRCAMFFRDPVHDPLTDNNPVEKGGPEVFFVVPHYITPARPGDVYRDFIYCYEPAQPKEANHVQNDPRSNPHFASQDQPHYARDCFRDPSQLRAFADGR